MKLTFAVVLAALIGASAHAHAGCGCDKPPPAPAAIIPRAAFPGMPVTLFHKSFRVGQTWEVTFHNGAPSATIQVPIVSKRALSDPARKSSVPQLEVVVPDVSVGPVGITVSHKKIAFAVPASEFTVIGKPVAVGEQTGTTTVKRYTTGVGADGTVYISVAGLNNVCQAMNFRGVLDGYPLQFGSGDIAITNDQGFFIERLDASTADHFSILPAVDKESNVLTYARHSFAEHCREHQPRGRKEVGRQDANWHRDGTPHTDYSTLIFAVAGHFADGSTPKPGSAMFDIQLQADVSAR